MLGFLIAGVSYLAYLTHATPYSAGYPSVLSQEARAVFGHGLAGTVGFALVQIASAAILYTGANTSFNGFPFLASFVAEDRFLPRQLTTRGHRLVFSNGIITLTVLAVALLLVTGGGVNALVPFYAIGVFTGFAMAGYGMTKHHLTHREKHWRRKLVINLSAGILATLVVAIFAIAKFTEGAWLVVIVFPTLVFLLIRLNREYRTEAAVLDQFRDSDKATMNYATHHVLVLVNGLDLAVVAALRYGRSLRPTDVTAVHFMVDATQADRLRARWDRLGIPTRLTIIDCPDRRITRAAQRLAADYAGQSDETEVTMLLPRRTYAPLLGRLLHDRTADRLARDISNVPRAVATIIPYDVQSRVRASFPDSPEKRITRTIEQLRHRLGSDEPPELQRHDQPHSPVTPICAVVPGERVVVEGRLREITDEQSSGGSGLTGEVADDTGQLTVHFDRAATEQPHAGQLVRLAGLPLLPTGDGEITLIHPHYEIVDENDDEDNLDKGNTDDEITQQEGGPQQENAEGDTSHGK